MGFEDRYNQSDQGWELQDVMAEGGMSVIDCHVHTYFSGDSSTTLDQLITEFQSSGLTHFCVTDHHSIAAYPSLREVFGPRVICGQELRTTEGEVIGLFLTQKISPGLNLANASKAIRDQGGIVYVCHPLYQRRFSVGSNNLRQALENGIIDAIELTNSKSLRLYSLVAELASEYAIPLLGGSDAHVAAALGSSGAVMPWFHSAADFLVAAKSATPFGHYCDPKKSWPIDVVPSISD